MWTMLRASSSGAQLEEDEEEVLSDVSSTSSLASEEYYDDVFAENNASGTGPLSAWTFDAHSSEGAAIADGKLGRRAFGGAGTSVTLDYDSSEADLLQRFKHEAKEVLRRVRRSVPVGEGDELSAGVCFAAAMPKDLLIILATWLKNRCTLVDILRFLKVHVKLSAYRCSKTEARERPAVYQVSPDDLEPHDLVTELMHRFDKPLGAETRQDGNYNEYFTVPPEMVEMQQCFRKHSSNLFFVKGVTWGDWGDDTSPQSAPRWELYGVRLIATKEGKLKPVFHLFASVTTGLLCGTWLETNKMKQIDALNDALLTIFRVERLSEIDSRLAKALWLFIDRGYIVLSGEESEDDIVQLLKTTGINLVGTCKNTASFPFGEKETDKIKARVTITKAGCKTLLSAQSEAHGLSAFLVRCGQGKPRVARLLSTDPNLRGAWVAKVARPGLRAASPGGVVRQAHAQPAPENATPPTTANNRRAGAITAMRSRLFELTKAQRTPDWFLARLFRSSSTSAHAIINCASAVFLHSAEMRELHARSKATAVLNPRSAVVLANAAMVTHDSADVLRSRTGGMRGPVPDKTKPAYWKRKFKKAQLKEAVVKLGLPMPEVVSVANLSETLASHYQQSAGGVDGNAGAGGGPDAGGGGGDGDDDDAGPAAEAAHTAVGDEHGVERGEREDGGEDANCVVHETRQRAFLSLMMRRWFKHPLSGGSKPDGALQIDTSTEAKVLKVLPHFLRRHGHGITMEREVWEFGLLARRDVPFVAASPDGLVSLRHAGDFLALSAVEVKTSTNRETEAELTNVTQKVGKFVRCRAGTASFAAAVPNASHRTQVVHHTAVMGVKFVLVVFATQSEISRCVLVDVDEQQRKDWVDLLRLVQSEYMGFAYGPTIGTLPRLGEDGSGVYGCAMEHHTVDVYLRLWRAHAEDVVAHGTPPPWKSLSPRIVSTWNKHMGNCNLARKVINSTNPRTSNKGPTMVVFYTILNYVLYNAFRVWQLAQCSTQLESFSTFSDVLTFRGKYSFRAFLFDLAPDIRKLKDLIPSLDEINRAWEPTTPIRPRAAHRCFPSQPGQEASTTASADASGQDDEVDIWQGKKRKLAYWAQQLPLVKKRRLDRNVNHVLAKETDRANTFCVMCCTLCQKGVEHTARKPRRPKTYCLACSSANTRVYLCQRDCWDRWHGLGQASDAQELVLPPCTTKRT